MEQPDNHIDEIFYDFIGATGNALAMPDDERHLETAKKQLGQYYADLYRNKIPEKREYPESTEEPTFLEIQATGVVSGFNEAVDLITAQFNSKGGNDG